MSGTAIHEATASTDGFPVAIASRFVDARSVERLGGERDQNLLVTTGTGTRHVLKIVDRDEAEGAIPLQAAALAHLARTAPDLPVPRVTPTREGDLTLTLPEGAAWMLSFRPGRLLSDHAAGAATLRDVGEATRRLTEALADFGHPALGRRLAWRLDEAAAAMTHLTAIADVQARRLAERVLLNTTARAQQLHGLPRQAIHGDLNPFNLVVAEDGALAGIIDFGDLHRGWRAGELAIALSYHLAAGEPTIAALLEGFGGGALDAAEREALPTLAAARLGQTLAITAARATRQPDQAPYLLRNAAAALAGLEWLEDGGHSVLRRLVAERLA